MCYTHMHGVKVKITGTINLIPQVKVQYDDKPRLKLIQVIMSILYKQ